MKRVVKLHEFVSACTQLLEGSDQVIRNLRKVASFTKIQKGTSSSDVFTEADIHIQNTIIYNLKQLYPRATIIGEEEDESVGEYTGTPYIQPDQLSFQHIS